MNPYNCRYDIYLDGKMTPCHEKASSKVAINGDYLLNAKGKIYLCNPQWYNEKVGQLNTKSEGGSILASSYSNSGTKTSNLTMTLKVVEE